MARIFVSHSSINNAEAVALRDWLADQGWNDLFLDLDSERGIAAGERWERALSEAASRSEAVLFLISRHWLASEWCLREFDLAVKLNKRIFGLLIEDISVPDLPSKVRDSWQLTNLATGADHTMFRAVMPDGSEKHVTFSALGLTRLKVGLTRAGLDPRFFAWPPDSEPDRPPYRGLRPLEADDAGIFFGREAPTIDALDRLRGLAQSAPARLFVIMGASGAGKSSFLRAGLVPRMQRDDRNFLILPVVRPERSVLHGETGLVRSLEAASKAARLGWTRAQVKTAVEAGSEALRPLLDTLVEKHCASALAGNENVPSPRLVLSIDQGEELFQAEGAEEAQAFLGLLGALATAPGSDLIVLVVIRSDSFEYLQTAPALEGIGIETFSLPPLPRGSYETVIKGPAARLADTPRALKIEPALTDALLADVEAGGGKDALPLLAFTLERLYLEHGGDGDLKLSEYREIGGIRGSIEAAVEQALKSSDDDPAVPRDRPARLALLRRALIPWLAGIDLDTGLPRRRVARLSEIPEEARPLVKHLVAQRLLATDVSPETGERTIEPAHEALLRQWGLLQGWLEENLAALSTLDGIKRAAREWAANARDKAWLAHSAGRLEDAEVVRARPDLAGMIDTGDRDYLEACRTAENARRNRELDEARKLATAQQQAAEHQRTVARRTRVGLIAAIVLAAAAIGAAFFGFEQARIAETREVEAVAEGERADAQARVAEQSKLEAEDQARRAAAREAEAVVERERADAQAALADDRARQIERAEANRVAALAEQALDFDRPARAAALVVSVAPDGPDTPGAMTPGLAAVVLRTANALSVPTERKLPDNVFSLALSPDGSVIAAGLAGDSEHRGSVHLLDAATLEVLATVRAIDGDVVSGLAFNPDGSLLAAAGGKVATVWDVDTAAKAFDLVQPEVRGFTKTVKFALDGTRIVIGTSGNRALVYDAANGKFLHDLEAASFEEMAARAAAVSDFGVGDPIVLAVAQATFSMFGSASEVAIAPDGRTIAVTGAANPDQSVRLFDAEHGMLLRTLSGGSANLLGGTAGYGNYLAFAPDGTRLLASPTGQSLKIWNIADGELVTELPGRGTEAILTTEGGRAVVTGHRNGTVVFRCIDGLAWTLVLKAHDAGIGVLVGDPEAGLLVSGARDGVKVWRLPSEEEICSGEGGIDEMRPLRVFAHGINVQMAAIDSARGAVIAAYQDGHVRSWPLADAGEGHFVLDWYGSDAVDPWFSPDGSVLFLRSCELCAYEAFDLSGERVLSLDVEAIGSGGADGQPVLFHAPDVSWRLGDPEPPEPAWDAPQPEWAEMDIASVTPSGHRALLIPERFADAVSPMTLFDAQERKVLATFAVDGKVPSDAAITADGRFAIALYAEKDAFYSDPATLVMFSAAGRQVATRTIEEAAGAEIELSPDQTRLLMRKSVGGDYWLQRVSSGELIGDPKANRDGSAFAFTPNGDLFVGETTGAIWHLPNSGGANRLLEVDGQIDKIAVTPEGGLIAVVDAARVLTVIDVATGKILLDRVLSAAASALAFEPKSGRLLVCHESRRCVLVAPATDAYAMVRWLKDVAAQLLSAEDRELAGAGDP